jgi:hypothetical protein
MTPAPSFMRLSAMNWPAPASAVAEHTTAWSAEKPIVVAITPKAAPTGT